MTPESLRKLIAGGENLDVEFKGEENAPMSDRDLLQTIVCLANRTIAAPAWLLIGVEDNGRVTGARPRHETGYTDLARLTALISNRTRPSIAVRVWLIQIDGCEVLAIEVPPCRTPVSTADGLFLRRAIGGDGRPACIPMQFHEMQAQQADRGLLDYSALVVPEAQWEDLDPLEFERLRRSIRERRGRSDEALLDLSDLELAKAVGAIEANGNVRAIRVLGLLLFGKEMALRRLLPAHEVAFQVLRGQAVEVNDFFRWPLLRVMEEIEARFRARVYEQELLVGLLRVGVPDYPPAAFREGVANALIHRDYTRLGAVHVQWHGDRIEISNPGGFPEGVRTENLLVTSPRPRNPLLADAFKRAGIVERTARGIDTIFYEQLRNGRPAPSYTRSDLTSVVLVLPGGEADLDFVRLIVEEAHSGRPPSVDDLLVLNALWQERTVTANMAAELIQKSESEGSAVLNRLAESGLIAARGQKQSRSWDLSTTTYRRLGEPVAYGRQQSVEPLQHELMVLGYLAQHGSISRREVAALCQLSSMQAYRVLKRLEKEGKIRRLGGSTKAVRYVRTPK